VSSLDPANDDRGLVRLAANAAKHAPARQVKEENVDAKRLDHVSDLWLLGVAGQRAKGFDESLVLLVRAPEAGSLSFKALLKRAAQGQCNLLPFFPIQGVVSVQVGRRQERVKQARSFANDTESCIVAVVPKHFTGQALWEALHRVQLEWRVHRL
jgi:hypothetical protein